MKTMIAIGLALALMCGIASAQTADLSFGNTTVTPGQSAAEPAESGAGPQGGMIGGPDAGHAIAPMAGGDLEFAWYRASVTAARAPCAVRGSP